MKKSLCMIFIFFYILTLNCKVYAKESLKNEHLDEYINLYRNLEDAVEVINLSENKISLTNEDLYLMAKVVYAESNAEPYGGKVAVASVILNRLRSPEFPKTIRDVIIQKNAFSCVVNEDVPANPDNSAINAVNDALLGKDPSNEALYYYNPKISTSVWMKNVKKQNLNVIGNHIFFNAN